jgi:predicted alpha/beta hydrolase family esterase
MTTSPPARTRAGAPVSAAEARPAVPTAAPATAPAEAVPQSPADRFLLLHGWQNRRPAGHWQRWLACELTALGHTVDHPQLPDPDRPDPAAWLAALRTRLAAPHPDRLTVIAHSLACLLWFRHAASDPDPGPGPDRVRVHRVLLVAPPSASFVRRQPEIAAFAPPPGLDPAHLAAAARHTHLAAADNDPYCAEGAAALYGSPLALSTHLLRGAGHLDLAAGYGPWPALLRWCTAPPHPGARLTPR